MADIVEGLFGVSPDELRAQRQARAQANALAISQIDPIQRAQYLTSLGGSGLMGGAMRAMGAEDKQAQDYARRQQLLSQVDMQTPEGILKAAEIARSQGDYQTQIRLQQLANQRREEIVNQEFKQAQTAQMLREKTSLNTQIEEIPVGGGRFQKQLIDKLTGQKIADIGVPFTKAEEKGSQLTAQESKELFEADDIVQASQNVQFALEEALKLNNKAYSGYAATQRAYARSNVPGESESANATIDLDNLMTGQALESLKATFGAMPTEGERKILLEMQASTNKTPAQREAIIKRAMAMARRREQLNADKAAKLRAGQYALPGGEPTAPQAGELLGSKPKSRFEGFSIVE